MVPALATGLHACPAFALAPPANMFGAVHLFAATIACIVGPERPLMLQQLPLRPAIVRTRGGGRTPRLRVMCSDFNAISFGSSRIRGIGSGLQMLGSRLNERKLGGWRAVNTAIAAAPDGDAGGDGQGLREQPDELVRPFECATCGKAYTTAYSLRRHMAKHGVNAKAENETKRPRSVIASGAAPVASRRQLSDSAAARKKLSGRATAALQLHLELGLEGEGDQLGRRSEATERSEITETDSEEVVTEGEADVPVVGRTRSQRGMLSSGVGAGDLPSPRGAKPGEGKDGRVVEVVVMNIDGASRGNPGPAAFGVSIRDGEGRKVRDIAKEIGMATCNEAEWNACIWGLRAAISLKATKVLVRSDSKLVVNQIQGEWKVKQPHLQILHQEAHGIASKLRKAGGGLVVKWVPRERNTSADKLANYALDHGSRVWEHPY